MLITTDKMKMRGRRGKRQEGRGSREIEREMGGVGEEDEEDGGGGGEENTKRGV